EAMKFEDIVVLLPCHSLDDFPMYHVGEDADDLLAAYSALWHPKLIADVDKMPGWRRSDDEENDLLGKLIVLPQVCQKDMPGYWLDDARAKGATVIEAGELGGREEIVQAALRAAAVDEAEMDTELVGDFFALGLAHLWTEVLTVQMRYSSLVDEDQFKVLLVAAAKAAVDGDRQLARQKLTACFDCLAESKDHFYPVDAYLLDLVLVADSTLGAELAAELALERPTNLLITAAQVREIEANHPDTLSALRAAIESNRVTLVGGESTDVAPIAVQSADTLISALTSADAIPTYRRALGKQPRVFGRRSYGLSPVLPQVLRKTGFVGALHLSLDGGRIPHSYQNKIQWEGTDGVPLDAFARMPLDASQAESFLALPQHLSESMDHDHVAAICLAHWPGQASPWYKDVERIARFGTVLGKFVTFEEFFSDTEMPGEPSRFEADEYRPPYLRRAVADGDDAPISKIANATCNDEHQANLARLETLAELVGFENAADDSGDRYNDGRTQRYMDGFASAVSHANEESPPGYLVVNTHSFTRTAVVETPELDRPPRLGDSVKMAFEKDGNRQVLVELPPVGYAWIAGDESQVWTASKSKPLVEDNLLRTEYFEARISPETGGVQSVHNFKERGNLFSQRLAMRMPGSKREPGAAWQPADKAPRYAKMVCDELDSVDASALTASIKTRGRLLGTDDEILATFRQTVAVERGRAALIFDVELETAVALGDNPWESYFAAMFAWPDDAEIVRSVGLGMYPTARQRIEAAHFVGIRGPRIDMTLLTGGLPYHLRVGDRQLDTLLIVKGEQQRRFRFAITLGQTHPQQAALDFITPPLVHSGRAAPPEPRSSWLFHLSSKNVIAVRWEKINNESRRGVRVRLFETAGRTTALSLRCFRPVIEARKVDFLGEPGAELQCDDEMVTIELVGHEICDVELIWQT
ncbi:MAG: hypothetical protein VB875_14880, partial [Pirellulales bacterium]